MDRANDVDDVQDVDGAEDASSTHTTSLTSMTPTFHLWPYFYWTNFLAGLIWKCVKHIIKTVYSNSDATHNEYQRKDTITVQGQDMISPTATMALDKVDDNDCFDVNAYFPIVFEDVLDVLMLWWLVLSVNLFCTAHHRQLLWW